MHIESLGSYQVLSEWGRNPAGTLLLAHDSETGSEVIIQLLELADGADTDGSSPVRDQLFQDISGLIGFNDEHLVSIIDADDQDGLLYIVTERPDGQSCDMFCRGGQTLPLVDALRIIQSAARGLHAAHKRGAVHGAIDPAMIYRLDAGRGKVGGFGLAAIGKHGLHKSEAPPRYASPESLRREPLTPAGDQFSLAVVLYELTTGRPAFPGDDESTVAYRVVNEAVIDPAASDPPLPAALAALLLRALEKQPEARFPDCAAFADALEQVIDEIPAQPTVAGHPHLEFSETELSFGDEPAASSPPPAVGSTETIIPRAEVSAPARHSARPFVLAVLLLALLIVAGWLAYRTLFDVAEQVTMFDARLSVEPGDVPVMIDGAPWLDSEGSGLVSFRGSEPFNVITAGLACRSVERRLEPADAGTEIVLVLDPISVVVPVDPPYDNARVQLNDDKAQTTPVDLQLDLCRDNRLTISAEGKQPSVLDIASGATPLEARTQINAVELDPIPVGTLELPELKGVKLVYYVDGERVQGNVRSLELTEGKHRLRYKNDFHWLDVTKDVTVKGGSTSTPEIDPRFATLSVQAFPSNCKVFLRRGGGSWKFLDETPAQRRVAVGELEIKVQLNPTGETRVERVNLKEGENPPVRVSFSR